MPAHTVEPLVKALLKRKDNSPEFIEELNSYLEDIRKGELWDDDVKYIHALAKRLGVSTSESEAQEDIDAVPDDVSFLEHATATAQETHDRWQRENRVDDEDRRDWVSTQLAGIAADLESLVLADARGEGGLGVPTGEVRVTLKDDDGIAIVFRDGNEADLEATPGYQTLSGACERLELDLHLDPGTPDEDDQEGEDEDEDPDTGPYAVEVVVSGW